MLWDTAAFRRTDQVDGAKNILNERIGLFSPFEFSLPKNQYTQCD
jgi:hypothetical protein